MTLGPTKKRMVVASTILLAVIVTAVLLLQLEGLRPLWNHPRGDVDTQERIGIGDVLRIEGERERFAALLSMEQDSAGAGGGGSSFEAAAVKIYLAHHHYMRGEGEAATVYIEAAEAFSEEEENSLRDELLRKGELSKTEPLETVAALPLFSFHRGRIAYTEGRYEESVDHLREGLFTQLDGLRELYVSSKDSDYLQELGPWVEEVLHKSEGAAVDIIAGALLRLGRGYELPRVYRRLWNRLSTDMEEDRFISYALLLSEELAGGKNPDTSRREELREVLERWAGEKTFNPNTVGIFVELFERAGMPVSALFSELEELEYRRPLLGPEGYAERVIRSIVQRGEREDTEVMVESLERFMRHYIGKRWTLAEEELLELREKMPPRVLEHRFFRYLEAAIGLRRGNKAELPSYVRLEPLFSTFQYYYLNLWEAVLGWEPAQEAVAVAALREGIVLAPETAEALQGRRLLWAIDGPGGQVGPGSELGPEAYPLLEEELLHIEEFIRIGASPVLMDPVLALLSHPDNLYTLNAELSVRRMRELPRVRLYLLGTYEAAEGRLRERLSSILRYR